MKIVTKVVLNKEEAHTVLKMVDLVEEMCDRCGETDDGCLNCPFYFPDSNNWCGRQMFDLIKERVQVEL